MKQNQFYLLKQTSEVSKITLSVIVYAPCPSPTRNRWTVLGFFVSDVCSIAGNYLLKIFFPFSLSMKAHTYFFSLSDPSLHGLPDQPAFLLTSALFSHLLFLKPPSNTLWSRTTKNPEVNTEQLARQFLQLLAPLTHSIAAHCSLRARARSAALICALTYIPTHSRLHGKEVLVHDMNALISYSFNP